VVADSAAAHGLEGLLDHLEGPAVARAFPVAQQEEEIVGRRELGGTAEPTVISVKIFSQLLVGQIQRLFP